MKHFEEFTEFEKWFSSSDVYADGDLETDSRGRYIFPMTQRFKECWEYSNAPYKKILKELLKEGDFFITSIEANEPYSVDFEEWKSRVLQLLEED